MRLLTEPPAAVPPEPETAEIVYIGLESAVGPQAS